MTADNRRGPRRVIPRNRATPVPGFDGHDVRPGLSIDDAAPDTIWEAATCELLVFELTEPLPPARVLLYEQRAASSRT